ncbi:MAG: glycosyltransferase [Chloroflexota bacterium]|nr:glycosyltransferase [Chloroflexota bacterium]
MGHVYNGGRLAAGEGKGEWTVLDHVDVGPRPLKAYAHIVGEEAVQEIEDLAAPLRGARIAHINATTYGGGVSELLRSIVPLYRGLGIQCDWKLISAEPPFFSITKSLHNALQGAPYELTRAARETYLMYNTRNAQLLEEQYDFIIVHDPQPAAMRYFRGSAGAKWIWRCHIDTSEPNEGILDFMLPFLAEYDALVFTMERFIPPRLQHQRLVTMTPAIDPLSPKNMTLPKGICHEIRAWRGIDPYRPLLTQVSRFDPWKDPIGVISVYRLVRREVPGLQLALLSSMASDDPEVWEIYEEIIAETRGDDDIHVLTNLIGVGDVEVNAFQACSDVVLQRSIREGFGLVVSETMWKGTPVVANRSGGIPLQMEDRVGGFLVDNTEQCVERTLYLLHHPAEARTIGLAGRERVRRRFLITRLLADELRLVASLSPRVT